MRNNKFEEQRVELIGNEMIDVFSEIDWKKFHELPKKEKYEYVKRHIVSRMKGFN